jgi:hypothetical protein
LSLHRGSRRELSDDTPDTLPRKSVVRSLNRRTLRFMRILPSKGAGH